jgi:hypothetical protein
MNNSPNRLLPVMWSVVIIVIISVIPLINVINLFCCAGIIMGGFAGSSVYARQLRNNNSNIEMKDGIIIGVLSGILSAVIVTGINLLIVLYSKENPVNEVILMLQSIGKDLPQEVYNQLNSFSAEFEKYGFSPTLSIFSLFMNLIIYPVFASLGGIFVALINKKKKNISQI